MAFDSIVIDISHHNGTIDLSQVASAGVAGVIHKATQGTAYTDPMYSVNIAQAQQNNLLWGAYHFGTGDDGTAQADAFLALVQPTPQTLLVLDFEENLHGPSMTLAEARDFLVRVQSQTGIWPGIYAGHYIKELLGNSTDPTLQNCWFWLSQYGPRAVVPPNWTDWTLWQYTDGAVGPSPQNIPGVGHCDQNCYNGTPADLNTKWLTGSL